MRWSRRLRCPLTLIVAAGAIFAAAESLRAQRAVPQGAWLTWGADSAFTRYSPLTMINKDNVRDLRVAWRWRSADSDLVSTAVAPGTIQVPPDGNPIVLMADAQTLGGYPRVAHVASVDIPLLAQLAPGDHVRFVRTTVKEAHALAYAGEHDLGLLRQGIAEKVRPA